MNKAIQDQLAPGSTFKIIMSVAGLQEGLAQDMHVNCVGGGTFYGRFFHCDHHHGVLNISQAIPLSCDTFFYTLAQKLGIDTIAKYATALGLGSKTGIDLPDEKAGIMPSTQWEMKNYHQRYYPGNTISVGIGQGETQVTPLQLARALGGIASGGHLVRPHVVMPGQVSAEFHQAVLDSFPGSGDVYFPLNPDTWSIITDGMAAATTTGTAAAAHMQGIDFAGKTGTAQVVGGGDTHTKGGAKTPNSWFVGMVPRRNPEIVIAVLQEHGDWGSNSAPLMSTKSAPRTTTSSIRQEAPSRLKWEPSGLSRRRPKAAMRERNSRLLFSTPATSPSILSRSSPFQRPQRSVPHPCAFFLAQGWETTNPNFRRWIPPPAVILSEGRRGPPRRKSKDLRFVLRSQGWQARSTPQPSPGRGFPDASLPKLPRLRLDLAGHGAAPMRRFRL
jgi:membrane peptidoglycan carboxypeptidase